jgi:hypothetical protein
MPLPKLLLTPERSGYTYTEGEVALTVKLAGGASKTRLDLLNATTNINVKWNCSLGGYNYLKAFYRTATKFGSLPFLIDLLYDSGTVEEYTAKFVSGTLRLTSQSGLLYVMEAVLEVSSNNPSADDDQTIIDAWSE